MHLTTFVRYGIASGYIPRRHEHSVRKHNLVRLAAASVRLGS
jgi:hypothetical protein